MRAILVIDVQESFRVRAEEWATVSAPDIVDRAASDLGFAVTFVIDATATHPHAAWDGGTISADDIQRATASALAGRFATVTTIDGLLA